MQVTSVMMQLGLTWQNDVSRHVEARDAVWRQRWLQNEEDLFLFFIYKQNMQKWNLDEKLGKEHLDCKKSMVNLTESQRSNS